MINNNAIDKFTIALVGFFQNMDYGQLFSYFKDALIIVTIVFGVLFIIVVSKIRQVRKESLIEEIKAEIAPPEEAVAAYDRRWDEIKKHVMSFNEAEWKIAVIEADKFTDDALKTGGYPGESMGERLMLIEPGQLLSLQGLWDAHKLRNLLVHDARYQINHRQAVLAIEAFEASLRELGALT